MHCLFDSTDDELLFLCCIAFFSLPTQRDDEKEQLEERWTTTAWLHFGFNACLPCLLLFFICLCSPLRCVGRHKTTRRRRLNECRRNDTFLASVASAAECAKCLKRLWLIKFIQFIIVFVNDKYMLRIRIN